MTSPNTFTHLGGTVTLTEEKPNEVQVTLSFVVPSKLTEEQAEDAVYDAFTLEEPTFLLSKATEDSNWDVRVSYLYTGDTAAAKAFAQETFLGVTSI